MNPSHRLGWLPDVPDVRDVPFRDMYMVPRKLPPRVDLRAGCSPVENQGDLGSCTAQALAGALEFLELAALGTSPLQPACARTRTGRPVFHDLSRLFIYYNERATMGTVLEDSGAMLRVGIKTMAKLGACKEELWPYDIARFASKPTVRCYAEAVAHTVKSYQRLASLTEMKSCLARGLPFVFGFAVYEHAMTPAVAKTGVIRLPRSGERMLGGHAIMAVGYDDAKGRLLFRNSWGASWGQKGYGEMPYDYLIRRELSNDFWCIQSTANDFYALPMPGAGRDFAASDLQLIVYDFDGVMTDNRVLVLQDGTEGVFANRSDGLAVQRIKKLGIPQLILSTETNPVVQARAAKLSLEVISGCGDKKTAMGEYCRKRGLDFSRVLYVGNDLNDLEIMRAVGYSCAPADAVPEIRAVARHVFKTNGGAGVLAELAGRLERGS